MDPYRPCGTTPQPRAPRKAMLSSWAMQSCPANAQSACQVIENAAVLTIFLSQVTNHRQVTNAFLAYDLISRTRTQKIVCTSRAVRQLPNINRGGVGGGLGR